MPPEERKQLGKAGVTIAEATEKHSAKLEKEIHDQIEGWLRIRGITYRHDRMDRKTTGTVGWPDFTFAIHGKAIAVEVKRPGETVSDEQGRCQQGLSRDGWLVLIAHSLNDVKSFVDTIEI